MRQWFRSKTWNLLGVRRPRRARPQSAALQAEIVEIRALLTGSFNAAFGDALDEADADVDVDVDVDADEEAPLDEGTDGETPVDEGGGEEGETPDEEVIPIRVTDQSKAGYAFIGENFTTLVRDLSRHFENADVDGYSLSEDAPDFIEIVDGQIQTNPESGDQGNFGSKTSTFTVFATNATGGKAAALFSLEVVNRLPEAVLPKSIELLAGASNGTQSFDLKIKDRDGDPVTAMLVTNMPAGGLSVQLQEQTDEDTEETTWQLVVSGKASSNQIGTHTVTLTLDDEHGGKTTKSLTVTVKDPLAEYRNLKGDTELLDNDLANARTSVNQLENQLQRDRDSLNASSDRIDVFGRRGDQLLKDRQMTSDQHQRQIKINIDLHFAKQQATGKVIDTAKAGKDAQAKVGPAETKLNDAKRAAEDAQKVADRSAKIAKDAPDKTKAQQAEKKRLEGIAKADRERATQLAKARDTVKTERDAIVKAANDASKVADLARDAEKKASKALDAGKEEASRLSKRLEEHDAAINKLLKELQEETKVLDVLKQRVDLAQRQLNGHSSTATAAANQLAKYDARLSELEQNSLLDRSVVRDYHKGRFADVAARPGRIADDIQRLTTFGGNLLSRDSELASRVGVIARRLEGAVGTPPNFIR